LYGYLEELGGFTDDAVGCFVAFESSFLGDFGGELLVIGDVFLFDHFYEIRVAKDGVLFLAGVKGLGLGIDAVF
jgi:hypothetical protein